MADDVTPLASLSLTHVYYVRCPPPPSPFISKTPKPNDKKN